MSNPGAANKNAIFTDAPTDAVIVSAVRTPVGRLRGGLAKVRADDLLALVYKEALKRAGMSGDKVDEAYAGCANQAGEDNRNVARMSVLLAGLPNRVPAVTLNRLCASGMEAVVQGSRAIRLGDLEVALCGGVENMSRAPFSMQKPEAAFPIGAPAIFDTALGWRYPNPKMEALFPLEQMGETAENLVDEYKLSREDQDAFALRSHQLASKARDNGLFDDEILPVSVPQRKGDPVVVARDEGPRGDTSAEKLAKLRPVFRKGGSVTAGNSSSLNDGAAALVLTSRAFAKANGLTIRGTVRGSASAGVDPRTMGFGPVPATQKLFAKTGITAGDLDAIELNEAFAAQALCCQRALDLDMDKVNIRGGAIALGHPLGCSGARILTTLLGILDAQDGRLGLATLCVGVGQGLSVLLERPR